MSTLLDTRLVALYSQHSIQYGDLLEIYELSTTETTVESIDTYRFDELLGLVVHLFVTTQSQQIREKLSALLPKFGSAAVLPLLKILCHLPAQASIHSLAQQSIADIAVYPLIIGLDQVLAYETNELVQKAAIQKLMHITRDNESSILLVLPKLVSQNTWGLIKVQLLRDSSEPELNHLSPEHRVAVQLDALVLANNLGS
ncbi:MAG: hypothetical protein AAGI69_07695 [Cyanobacteria bacterium P01_H01_bin.21]